MKKLFILLAVIIVFYGCNPNPPDDNYTVRIYNNKDSLLETYYNCDYMAMPYDIRIFKNGKEIASFVGTYRLRAERQILIDKE